MKRILASIAVAATTAFNAFALDWYTWRGPDNNSISKETGWNAAALKNGPKIRWSVQLGEGYSIVAVKDGRVYSMGNNDGTDVVYCLDEKSGKEVWRYAYACDDGSYPGPRATPVVDGKLLYTLSRDGDLLCLNTADGSLKWSKKVIEEFRAQNIKWGLSSSTIVAGDMLLINAGDHGMALDKMSGKLLWGKPGQGNYASPVLFTQGGTAYAAVTNSDGLNVVTVKDGRVAAFHPWEASWQIIATDPVVHNGHILMSAAYGKGSVLLKFTGSALTPVWENANLEAHFSTPVLAGGYLYGASGNAGKKKSDLRCVEFMTGEVKWTAPLGFGNLVAADGRIIYINEGGMLHIAEMRSDKYVELSSGPVLDEKVCWTMPVLANGTVYCRNSPGTLVAVEVSK